MKFKLEYIESLIKIMNENNLSEIQLGEGDKTLTLKKELAISSYPQVIKQIPQPQSQEETVVATTDKAIKSPIVGTFYSAPAPNEPPYVSVGSLVAQGEIVCIIEAMKLMNEIESEYSGKIIEICVENGQQVEYGQVLMYIE